MADEGFAIKLGAFEQEAFIDGFSTSASAGLNATLNSLSKWLVAAVFGIIFLWRHDAEALWAASGSVLNAGLSTVLKRILNQERPVSTIRSDPGMPSSHAQSIFYTVMFCIVSSNIPSQLDEENMLGGRIFWVKWNHCSHKRAYLCNWLLLVMASGFATTPHSQPSSRRCYAWIFFLRFLVLVVGCSGPESIFIPPVGSAYYCSWRCRHLCHLSPICGSILGS